MFLENIITPVLNSIKNEKDSNAFCIAEVFYSYSDFGNQISKIRNALSSEQFKGKNIGLVANDDIETYASIFALWLDGLAYVPLHPKQPIERGLDIISQADINIVLDSSERPLFDSVSYIKTNHLPEFEMNLIPTYVSDYELAYILFTSGSTGKPKGVPITRNSIGSFMKSFCETGFNLAKNDRCLQCFDLTFDVSVQSYLSALTVGACVYTVPHDEIKNNYIYGLLEDHQITFGAMAPSMIRFLKPYFDEIRLEEMKHCILTAEASQLELVEEWSKCIPNARIYDFYGPTEATIYCTWYEFKREVENKHANGLLCIGKAMNYLKSIIVDEQNNSLGIGEKGELCIAGPQLTLGYWKNEIITASSFFDKEIEGVSWRFYKTGDLCYYDMSDDILYCGRKDSQVKIQGYRIELGEIEYHTRNVLQGKNAVAIAYEDSIGNTEIALFIESELSSNEIIVCYLKEKIPSYMIPSKFINVSKFPLNQNGKIDKNSLKTQLN